MNEESPSNKSEPASRLLVMVPTYNDVDVLGDIVTEIYERHPAAAVMVLDDGSTPPIPRSVVGDRCLLVRLPGNYGLGTCMHIAFDYAISQNFDIVARIDADGQHPIDRLGDIIAPLLAGEADYVVGCRTNRNEGKELRAIAAPLLRGYMSLCARVLSGGRTPPDVTSGFIAAGSRAIRTLNANLLEQYPEPQMCLAVGQAGLRTASVNVNQSSRSHGRSTVSVARALQLFYRFTIILIATVLQKPDPR